MLLFGFECDVKNVSLSQIFLTESMLVVVTVVFGQIVRVIRLVLRVSWCESQNASLQALFVCTLMVGMWYQSMQRYCAAGENFGLSAGNHVLLNGSQRESNSLQITKPTLTSPTSPVQSMDVLT